MYNLILFFKKKKPYIKGKLFKVFYSGKKIKVGKNFSCETFPEITVTDNAKVVIRDNVEFRRNVEIRAHKNSEIVFDGKNRIDRGVRLLATNSSRIILKEGSRVGLYSVFNGGDSIEVGKYSLISGFVYLQTSMHEYKGLGSIQDQGYSHKPIVLEDDTWLGTHVVILPGVTLSKGSIVGSNAVVNISSEQNSILAGVPARVIKTR